METITFGLNTTRGQWWVGGDGHRPARVVFLTVEHPIIIALFAVVLQAGAIYETPLVV